MTIREAISRTWLDAVDPDANILSLGHDIATSAKGEANPSALAVMQRVQPACRVPLLVAWKTQDPRVSTAILRLVLNDLASVSMKARRLCLDASSERFHAANLRRDLGDLVAVELVAGNDKLTYKGQSLDAKTLLGNLYTSALEDGFVVLPPGDWIKDDQRLVVREGGGFVTRDGKHGQHGDTFDACKLAYWGLVGRGGSAEASAVAVGSFASKPERPGRASNPVPRRRLNERTRLYA